MRLREVIETAGGAHRPMPHVYTLPLLQSTAVWLSPLAICTKALRNGTAGLKHLNHYIVVRNQFLDQRWRCLVHVVAMAQLARRAVTPRVKLPHTLVQFLKEGTLTLTA